MVGCLAGVIALHDVPLAFTVLGMDMKRPEIDVVLAGVKDRRVIESFSPLPSNFIAVRSSSRCTDSGISLLTMPDNPHTLLSFEKISADVTGV